MPLSGEAIRLMNYIDDVAVTLRRILATVPSLSAEERARVAACEVSGGPRTSSESCLQRRLEQANHAEDNHCKVFASPILCEGVQQRKTRS